MSGGRYLLLCALVLVVGAVLALLMPSDSTPTHAVVFGDVVPLVAK